MKTLKVIALSLALSLGIIGCVSSQDFKYEKDRNKYIPKRSKVHGYDLDCNGVYDAYWWDRNKDDELQEMEEMFVDLNDDGIPDMNYFEFTEFIEDLKMNRKNKQLIVPYDAESA